MPRIQERIDSDGAVIHVGVEVGAVDADDLRARGLPVPSPMRTTGLIDTGASRTILHPAVTHYLGLIARGFTEVETAGPTGPNVIRRVPLYDARITLGGHAHPQFAVEAAQVAPATSGVLVIIGRDILMECALVFDGRKKRFRLWI
jgi:hypothetical protein